MKQKVYQAILMEPVFYRIEDGGVRCFLVEGDDRAMLVDTGQYPCGWEPYRVQRPV